MNKLALEYLAAESIDRARRGEMPESNRVELKRALPVPPASAARRIAALANAARGEDVVVVVGIDEEAGATRAVNQDLAAWWAGVREWFDGEPPAMEAWHTTDALLLGFDTSGGPYVVKTLQEVGLKGQPTHEVPWREGNQTRTARRRDLVQLLVPMLRVPGVDVLSGELRVDPSKQLPSWNASGSLRVFMAPSTRDLLTFPAHRATLGIETTADLSLCDVVPTLHFEQAPGSLVNANGPSQVYLDAPGITVIKFAARLGDQLSPLLREVRVTATLHPILEGPPTRVVALLHKVSKAGLPELIWRC